MRAAMCPSRFTPYDEPEYPCEICGEHINTCICPDCPVCGSVGDPDCYRGHGLKRTEEQKFLLECNTRQWEAEAKAEWAHMAQFMDDIDSEVR